MPRVKKVVIDYEKKVMEVEFAKDNNLPSGTHYTPFRHYPLIAGNAGFLRFGERQQESDNWSKLRHDFADINKDIHLVLCLCNAHQLRVKENSMETFSVTYAFDFGKTVEQKYGGN